MVLVGVVAVIFGACQLYCFFMAEFFNRNVCRTYSDEKIRDYFWQGVIAVLSGVAIWVLNV
jgi:hypothetical protein